MLAACGSAPVVAPPATAVPEPYPHAVVWTVAPDVVLRDTAGAASVPFAFTRLDVIGRDSAGVKVACSGCSDPVSGYVDEGDVAAMTAAAASPASQELVPFLLWLRGAAERRDTTALRAVMAPDFSHDFVGIQSPEFAFQVWSSEDFRRFDQIPSLLDRGTATLDGRIWVSPPEFLTTLSYNGPRLGVRQKADGQWEWVFFIGN